MRRSPGIAALVALALAACGDPEPPAAAAATVDTVDGTERFLYAAEPARALPWALDTVTVIGDAFAEEPYQFNEVSASGLASNGAGHLLLLDRQGKRVLDYDRAGAHLATQDMVQLETGNRVMITMMSREFHPEFQWAAFPDGSVVVSDTAAYLLHLLAPDGSEVRRIARLPAPRAVTEGDRAAVRERAREESGESIRIGGSGPDEDTRQRMLEQRLEKMTFADIVPRIIELRVDPRDRIWVGVTGDVADELARIDIYDRDGRLLGELRDFPMPDVFIGELRPLAASRSLSTRVGRVLPRGPSRVSYAAMAARRVSADSRAEPTANAASPSSTAPPATSNRRPAPSTSVRQHARRSNPAKRARRSEATGGSNPAKRAPPASEASRRGSNFATPRRSPRS